MHRFFTVVAFASLTVHAAIVSTTTVNASNTSCAASGADGCSCQRFVCDADGAAISCRTGEEWDENDGCTEGGVGNDLSYETAEGANATVCTSSGPMVGAGCSHGTQAACKKIRTCALGPYGYCEDFADTEAGFFEPCTPNN